ncbi:MAG: glucose-6-phosphate dehydrogenase [Desulfobulbaceae bacterium]|nr:glucose-6-phosphate dehydrogenase [Desulfobulbaceae bacterium]
MASEIIEKEIISTGKQCESLPVKSDLDPCVIVIFGASGDLTVRKLIPSLFQMFSNNSLPDPVTIVGCARTSFSHDSFRDMLKEACRCQGKSDIGRWSSFASNLFYQQIQYDSEQAFQDLASFLQKLDLEHGTKGNYIFDMALPPTLYEVVAENLGKAGLSNQFIDGKGWSRIVVEKPFGSDLASALALDQTLRNHFQEEQIFRIDHYLAKETVQNILMFRFANAIFEPIWNRGFIDYVGIMASEKLGVENRAGYYEQAGVIRDMFQNHMLQLMSLIAMEPPSHFESERVRDEKVKLFGAIRPFQRKNDEVILGQYGPGEIDGQKVAGYLQEPKVAIGSLIPTFAMMRFYVENWRWQGVPFYLISGKRMARKETSIVVQFKQVPHSMFRDVLGKNIIANRLVFGIYPEEKISLTFQTKSPGTRVCLRSMTMDFRYEKGPVLDAYEKVLLDCILGDHLLFWRQDGVEAAWKVLTPVLNECEHCQGREQKLHQYPAGTWGPDEAREWVDKIV